VFIELTSRYPEDVLPSLWDRLDRMLKDGSALIPRAVQREYHHEPTEAWLLDRKELIRAPDSEVGECMKKIASDLPDFIDAQRTKESADPWLVAHAMAENLRAGADEGTGAALVVCEEGRRKGPQAPHKVPDACDHYGIDCIKVLDLMRREGIRL
jgi:hypothetical protein